MTLLKEEEIYKTEHSNSIFLRKEKAKVKYINSAGVGIINETGEEKFIYKNRISHSYVDIPNRYFKKNDEISVNIFLENGQEFCDTKEFKFKDYFEEENIHTYEVIEETISYLQENYGPFNDYLEKKIFLFILHFGMENFIPILHELLKEEKITYDVINKAEKELFKLNMPRYFDVSNHSGDRWCSDRVIEDYPSFLSKSIIINILQSSKVHSINRDHIYFTYNDFVFPCVRKAHGVYAVKTVLTWDLFNKK